MPGRLDGLVRDERGDEVAEEGLPVRRTTVQMPVFQSAAGHCLRWKGGGLDQLGFGEVEELFVAGESWISIGREYFPYYLIWAKPRHMQLNGHYFL